MPSRGALFTRSFNKAYPVAIRGEGVWLWDAEGKRYLDFAGSAAVNFIGHGDRDVATAIAGQLENLEFVHSSQFVTGASQKLGEEVLRFAGPNFESGAVFFTSGGSEAVETAIKLARQYQVEIGQSQRVKLLSRKQAYHGATVGAMSISGNRKRKEIHLPLLREYEQVATPYCYRCAYGCSNCAEKYAGEVEQALERDGKNIAAFFFEPISGATIGAAAPPDRYPARVLEACRSHGVLAVDDEVMTGFGRTGRNFAIDHWNVAPDIMVVGKGIASGYMPLGAVIASKKVVEAIAKGSGAFVHGFTYNAHPVACAAGLAVLKQIREGELVCKANSDRPAQSPGTWMKSGLQALTTCSSVGDVRGRGLLWAVEFVADRDTKAPYPTEQQFAARVAAAAVRRGVMTYPMQGCVDGMNGDHILLAPPAVISQEDVSWAIERLVEAIRETEKG